MRSIRLFLFCLQFTFLSRSMAAVECVPIKASFNRLPEVRKIRFDLSSSNSADGKFQSGAATIELKGIPEVGDTQSVTTYEYTYELHPYMNKKNEWTQLEITPREYKELKVLPLIRLKGKLSDFGKRPLSGELFVIDLVKNGDQKPIVHSFGSSQVKCR